MESPLYSLAQDKKDPDVEEDGHTMEMDTAAALVELRALTDSALRNLVERRRRRPGRSLSSAPACVVQMNSKFVTKFSVSKSSHNSSDSEGEALNQSTVTPVDSAPPLFHIHQSPLTARDMRRAEYSSNLQPSFDLQPKGERKPGRLTNCRYSPYSIKARSMASVNVAPSQLRLENMSLGPQPAIVADRASSPAMPRQDSGNKSNPSSPAKSQSCLSTTGSSIVRSRSLDDLEISKLEDSKVDCYSYGKCDIDTVSQHISKLHVS